MLVGVAPLPFSFPPSGTWAFYSINRPPWANISDPSVITDLCFVTLFDEILFTPRLRKTGKAMH